MLGYAPEGGVPCQGCGGWPRSSDVRGKDLMRRVGAALVAWWVICLLLAPGQTLAQGDLDCADFDSKVEVQAEYDADLSDPNGLDADNDGEACETFGYGGPSSGQYNDEGANEEKDVVIKDAWVQKHPATRDFVSRLADG